MTRDIINEVNNKTDLRRIFKEIREDIEKANSREDLNKLYKRTVYMILMTHASPLDVKFDREMKRRREVTEREFARAVRMINRQAKKIGTEADYNEKWDELATNGYETADENLLEPQNGDEGPKRIKE